MAKSQKQGKYTYVHHCYAVRRSDGAIKIGYSKRIEHRFSVLRKKHGELDVLGVLPGDERLEAELHSRFAAFNIPRTHPTMGVVSSEWFHPTIELYAFIGEHMERYEPYAEQMRRVGNHALAEKVEQQLGKFRAKRQHTATPANSAAVSTGEAA